MMRASELKAMAERMMAREAGDPEVTFWVCGPDVAARNTLIVGMHISAYDANRLRLAERNGGYSIRLTVGVEE